ncbi:hypothetical protein LX32DRAFT_241375 [Colletotrichum zoysiae]|uniref:Uncharacterized protein n=1 Tax=Colletotrichum zoysiae TaxID=1216348 RepID=A0AAD9H5D7_9PEZI|nr:hypothetical protein LX32DRAFT_241375 [Colletotrichum zoysiae]
MSHKVAIRHLARARGSQKTYPMPFHWATTGTPPYGDATYEVPNRRQFPSLGTQLSLTSPCRSNRHQTALLHFLRGLKAQRSWPELPTALLRHEPQVVVALGRNMQHLNFRPICERSSTAPIDMTSFYSRDIVRLHPPALAQEGRRWRPRCRCNPRCLFIVCPLRSTAAERAMRAWSGPAYSTWW